MRSFASLRPPSWVPSSPAGRTARRRAPTLHHGLRSLPRQLSADALSLALLPAAATAALAFTSGGFSPQPTGLAVAAVLALALLRCTVAREPGAGITLGVGLAGGALVLFAAWTLVSSAWSDAPARATLEADRALLYALVLLLAGSLGRSARAGRLLLTGLAAAGAVVVLAALASFLLPETLSVGAELSRDRLSWPTSYWNTTGLLAGLWLIWLAGVTCASSLPLAARAAAAAGVPFAAAALYATVSRGAAGATVVGLLVFVVAVRDRSVLVGFPVVVLGAAAGLVAAGRAEGLATQTPGPAALSSGREVVLLLVVAALGCAAVRALAWRLEARIARARWRTFSPRAKLALAAGVVAVLAGTAVVAGAPGRFVDAADRFGSQAYVPGTLAPSKRFTQLGNNGRIAHWRVAFDDGFRPQPLIGQGAGTYPLLWARYRQTSFTVIDGHSLPLEVAAELGVVGVVLVLVALGTILVGLVRRCRGPERAAWAALLGSAVAWLLHAGIDWDWEMPVVTLWLMAAGGLALSRERVGEALRDGPGPHRYVRLGAGLACIGLALVPVRIALSQDRLESALASLRAGDCRTAEDEALSAQSALSIRPEPFEILAYCDVRASRGDLARRAIDHALTLDPRNWELHYARGLVLATNGGDPRPSTRLAARLNPRDRLPHDALRSFTRAPSRQWRQIALRAPLPIRP
jgi:hypothetical protein